MLTRNVCLALFCASTLFAQKKPITIDTVVQQDRAGHGESGGGPVWAPDGKRFVSLRGGRIMLYDVASKSEKPLLSIDELEKNAVDVPDSEKFDWQNRRVSETDLQWSPSGKQLLVTAGGDLFLVSFESGKWDQLTATPVAERDAKLSPDGTRVAFRREHDLYSLEIASRKVTRLTNDGSPTLLNGELDWVYPEELNLGTAFWWSPDSKHIAYLQFDTAREFVYPQVALGGRRAIAEPERYPQAGTPNADVHVGVVAADGGGTQWMDLGDPRNALFARVYWTPDSSRLAVKRLNRVQNQLDLCCPTPPPEHQESILHESDPYWINNNDVFRFLHDGQFLWGSERDGFEHLYLYGLDGQLHKQLTEGNWEVTNIAGLDERNGTLYFVSTEESPLERQLYSVKLSGKDRKRISQGDGTHTISMSPTASYYMDSFSSLTQPTSRTLHTADGAEWAVYRARRS